MLKIEYAEVGNTRADRVEQYDHARYVKCFVAPSTSDEKRNKLYIRAIVSKRGSDYRETIEKYVSADEARLVRYDIAGQVVMFKRTNNPFKHTDHKYVWEQLMFREEV